MKMKNTQLKRIIVARVHKRTPLLREWQQLLERLWRGTQLSTLSSQCFVLGLFGTNTVTGAALEHFFFRAAAVWSLCIHLQNTPLRAVYCVEFFILFLFSPTF